MNPSTSMSVAAPRIVKGAPLLLFGLSEVCESTAAIPAQWGRFVPHLGHIAGQIGSVTYGVIHKTDDSGNYDYMCGVEVAQFPASPLEFARLRLEPRTYAVFEHAGHISSISATWKTIWDQALGDAGCKAAEAPAFERYDERFNAHTGFGGLEIWIPIQE